MAVQRALLSFEITDGSGRVASMPIHLIYDDATATLSAIATNIAVIANFVDDIIDGQITGVDLTLQQDVPAGLKVAPLAPSNVQETGLFTFQVVGTPYKYAVDLPTIAEAVQSDGQIPNTGLVADFITRVENVASALTFVEPISKGVLGEPSLSRVTFRKRGRR